MDSGIVKNVLVVADALIVMLMVSMTISMRTMMVMGV